MTKDEQLANFCARPFDSLMTMNFGEYKMCCDSASMGQVAPTNLLETWNGETWKEVRRAFLKGEKHPACQTCWQREAKGISTPRESGRRFHSLLEECATDGTMTSAPRIVSLRLGNACNLKCVMCAPFNSSKWSEDLDLYTEHIERKQAFVRPPNPLDEDWPLESFASLEHLTFIGGEPLLMKSHQKILEHLIESGRASQVTLKYFTNTTLLPDWCVRLWSSFAGLELRSSLDGIDATFDYIRYPGRWPQVEGIIRQINDLKHPRLEYGICFVFMSLNALNLEALFRWRNQFHWKITPPPIRPDFLTEPSILSARLLRPETQKRVLESLERIKQELTLYPVERTLLGDLQRQMTDPTLTVEKDPSELFAYLQALDQRRSTSWQSLASLKGER